MHPGPHAEVGVVLEMVDGEFGLRLGPIGRQDVHPTYDTAFVDECDAPAAGR